MSANKTNQPTVDFSANANEKGQSFLGSLMAYNIKAHGQNLPGVYAQTRAADPLPGEDLTDSSHINELEKILRFKSDR